ncbi:MAG: cytochrome c3 family protein [Bacteroidota bacterium]
MNRLTRHIFLLLSLSLTVAQAQLSPGDLTSAHAEFEGLSNCTLCHDLGNKVTNQKCLECHEDIQSFLDANQGYHAHQSVRQQDCFTCHSEHHGRRFDMVRFDQDAFDHNLTGYELEGQHDVIDCRECHAPENIADPEIRRRENTFLGLDQECLSCHDDYHQQTLSEDCISCHNFEGFRPAPGFDHNEADFALRGEHANVDCIECHAETTRNGQEFQEFSGIPFGRCTDCHDDVHNGQLPGTCTQCHDETSFSRFLGQRRFRHDRTGFSLKGAHKQEDCYSCHTQTSNPLQVFQDQLGIAETSCISCHEDHHEGKYGEDCAQCHNEESFLSLNDNLDFFDHSVTDYPLEGLHREVDCRSCHTERFSTAIDFSECKNCHEDYHNGQFASSGPNGQAADCNACHTLEQDFTFTSYSIERHQESAFPLEGAHMATPCFACHIDEADPEQHWSFREVGQACIDCHENIHEGYISDKFYPNQDCASCHGSESWASTNIQFDHNLTNWPLEGKHQEVDCRACHFEAVADNSTEFNQQFIELSTDCISCHDNVHGDDFAIDGVTDCVRCHVTTSWLPEKFDHNTTAFPLEGKHAELDCRACHEVEDASGSTVLLYKLEKFECIDCHQ